MPRGVVRAPATGYSLRLGPVVDSKLPRDALVLSLAVVRLERRVPGALPREDRLLSMSVRVAAHAFQVVRQRGRARV